MARRGLVRTPTPGPERPRARGPVLPAEWPPPFSPDEVIASPTDPPDERIDVGVLLEEHPEVAERLGGVPVAVLEKGKQPGSHLLSGAVVNPRALQRLFRGHKRLDELPFAGRVEHESVYFLTRSRALRIP